MRASSHSVYLQSLFDLDVASFDLLAGVMELTVDGYLLQSRGKQIDCFAWLFY